MRSSMFNHFISRSVSLGMGLLMVSFGFFGPAPAEAQGEISLACKNTFKAAKGYKIKRSELPSEASCSFPLDIQVRATSGPLEGQVFFGIATYTVVAPPKKLATVFSGFASDLVAHSEVYLHDGDFKEVTLPSYEILNVSPSMGESTGGAWTVPSGVVCTAAARVMSRVERFPYNPNIAGGSDYENKSITLSQSIAWECRR